MPVFVERASADRDSRVNPVIESALPRITPPPPIDSDKYEVIIAGSGPAGLMLSVCLAHYGIQSVLTVDKRPSTLKAGQADGIQPRTIEVLQSLDLAHEMLTQGCLLHEVAFWNPKTGGKGIERTAFVADVAVPSRYPHELTIHQGRIERILFEDLEKYGKKVQRGTEVVGFELKEDDKEWPVEVTLRDEQGDRKVRTKFLVGCDGAHSTVRKAMGLELEGDTTDHVWGVMDAVITSTFPDIRKRCAIHSSEGSIMIIPRERIPGGKVLTRVYCQMSSLESASKAESKAARNAITLERLTTQTAKALAPYTFSFSDVDWWAAYQIGQRTASAFSLADSNGVKRVHIAGDACHTHSPKAGQGMNVSMMDTYNLSFKLAHVLNGLAPPEILDTYESERLDIARQLIEFDTKFSSMFSGRIGEDSGLTHDEFVSVFRTGGGFTSGCGIEYGPGMFVDPQADAIKDGNRSLGLLWPGRRLMNVRTIRFADANPRNLQDDFASTGVYRILLMLPRNWREQMNMQQVIQKYTSSIPDQFPRGAMETAIMYPGERGDIEWTDFPEAVRERNEWLLLGDAYGEAYTTFGVNEEVGAVAVVRPDGYVGMVGRVEETARVRAWLGGVLNAIPDGPQ